MFTETGLYFIFVGLMIAGINWVNLSSQEFTKLKNTHFRNFVQPEKWEKMTWPNPRSNSIFEKLFYSTVCYKEIMLISSNVAANL